MKIAVASCSKLQQINPQPVWEEIRLSRPDVLLLLGDNIYLEHDHHSEPIELRNELRELYQAQFAEPHFSALLADVRARDGKVLAIYDDHDFLGNNRYGGEVTPALRAAARDEFIHWFHPLQTGADVYSLSQFDLVDVVVLDERFYRTSPSVSAADRDAILGAKQWNWFEKIVTASTKPYLLVASSTTIHTWGDESWEQYDAAFARLRKLLGKRKGAFVLSGDVHRNVVYDDSGIVELVTSAVARNGLLFGAPRKNYALLELDPNRLHVDMRSLKAGWRFIFDIPLSNWMIP